VSSVRGVVSCGHLREAEAGVRMLEAGGNAIDAVVAAAFTGFVVEPASCGLGGFGHLAVYLAETRQLISVDHYVEAPAAARPDMFAADPRQPTTYYGWPAVPGRRNEWGGIAVAVPGAVAGLCAAHESWGSLPLAEVLEPAIEAAEADVPVGWDLVLAIVARLEQIEALPDAAALLLRHGRPPQLREDGGATAPPELLDTSQLARTLHEIAGRGAAGFYEGWVASAIEHAVATAGGILTVDDLVAYRPRVKVEAGAWYRGVRYSTAADPVGYETLNILSSFDLATYGPESSEYRHLTAEAMGHAFADNMHYYSDPDFGPNPVSGLLSPEFAAKRATGIRLDRAAPRPIAAADPWPFAAGSGDRAGDMPPSAAGLAGTSHMVAADGAGNLAALITALTSPFGSLVLVPEGGFFLNNSMRNFDPRPERANSIAPGKRPIFAVPAIAAERDGEAIFAAAGAGGYRIASAVLHAFLNHLDFEMPVQQAVDQPRVHCQGEETFVDSRIPYDVRERLRELGHLLVVQDATPAPLNFARVGAVARDPQTASLSVGGNPSWNTASLSVEGLA
jgi:gamma-glutamyltranspeptidase / glutathione hydrolase